jgi:hypothetical protein
MYSQRNVALIVNIHGFDRIGMPEGSRILGGSSVNTMYRHSHREDGGNIPYISTNSGCNILVYGCLGSSATYITEDARPMIIDPPSTVISKMW